MKGKVFTCTYVCYLILHFLCVDFFMVSSLFSMWKRSFVLFCFLVNISCSSSLVETNSLSFFWLKDSSFLLLPLKDIYTGYRILVWHYFKNMFHCLLATVVSDIKSVNILKLLLEVCLESSGYLRFWTLIFVSWTQWECYTILRMHPPSLQSRTFTLFVSFLQESQSCIACFPFSQNCCLLYFIQFSCCLR